LASRWDEPSMGTLNRSRRAGLVLVAALAAGPATPGGLAGTLPSNVPAPQTRAGWERVSGEVRDGDAAVVYELYVNPIRPGLYELTRFRVDRLEAQGGGRARRVKDNEKLLWNARPGTNEPLICYERTGRRSWRTLWLRRWSWRRLGPDTAESRAATFTAIRLHNLRRPR